MHATLERPSGKYAKADEAAAYIRSRQRFAAVTPDGVLAMSDQITWDSVYRGEGDCVFQQPHVFPINESGNVAMQYVRSWLRG